MPRPRSDIPAVISFTTETDGKLPTGQTLGEAIEVGGRRRQPRRPPIT